VTAAERRWADTQMDAVVREFFPTVVEQAPHLLDRPLLCSGWLSRAVTRVPRDKLREYLQARLKVAPPLSSPSPAQLCFPLNAAFAFRGERRVRGVVVTCARIREG